jgi:uncharacterized protein (DUF924 family)
VADADVIAYEPVFHFWFAETDPKAWWAADPAFDERIRGRFAALHAQAAQGELYGWRTEPRGRLAEIIVLDQFSRNLFRGSARAFAQDLAALALAQEAISAQLPDSRLMVIPEARHEILKESDAVRAVFWDAFDRFVDMEIR